MIPRNFLVCGTSAQGSRALRLGRLTRGPEASARAQQSPHPDLQVAEPETGTRGCPDSPIPIHGRGPGRPETSTDKGPSESIRRRNDPLSGAGTN